MKKYLALLCSIAFLFTTVSGVAAEIIYGNKTENPNLTLPVMRDSIMEDGLLVLEAENMILSKDAAIIEQADASEGFAVQVTGTPVTDPNNVLNPTFYKDIIVDNAGNYRVWLRVKTLTDGSDSVYIEKNGAYTQMNFTAGPDYYWRSTDFSFVAGENTISFKYRERGFILDKIIVTNNVAFVPEGIDDLPEPGGGTGSIYDLPTINPIEGHPRLFVTPEYIPTLQKNMKSEALAPMYERIKNSAYEDVEYKLPDRGGSGNYNSGLTQRLKSRAFVYLLGDADDAHGKATIQHMTDYLATIVFPNVQDITRSMGDVMITAAMVYDWCYDLMTDADKDYFVRSFKRIAAQKEVGYPPTNQISISGHSGEREIMLDLIGSGIACYDEDPEMYNLAAGRFFQEFVDSRTMFNKTGSHPIGNAYGHTRFQWELFVTMIYDRMGYSDILGEEMATVAYKWIYQRLPFGYWFKDGDDYIYSSSGNTGFKYSTNDALCMLLAGALYKDPIFSSERLREFVLENYNDTSFWILLFFDPEVDYAFNEDLPLAYRSTYPLTQVTARTSWQTGIDAPTAMVFMKGNEKMLADHNFADIGSFQIYYKGNLANKHGLYAGTGGGWGGTHDFNYNKRTISSNSMVVYDPNEIFLSSLRNPSSARLSNDGGQGFRKIIDNLEQFLAAEDEAATEGVYIGPNEDTPEFSYLKTDLTNAYSDKISDYHRSMVFMDLFDEDYPAAFVVYDKMDTSNKDFEKKWLLQSIEEPTVEGNTTTISRTEFGFNGKLVNKTLLPAANNLKIDIVGGDGKQHYVDGINYESIPNTNRAEGGDWRIEVSPVQAAEKDVFLNAMYVTDHDRDLPELPMIEENMSYFTGVTVKDRTVLFSKQSTAVTGTFSLNIRDNGFTEMSVLVTDVAAGKWKVAGGGKEIITSVGDGENALYFKGMPGNYSISPVGTNTEVTEIVYPKTEKAKIGDFLIYKEGLFLNQKKPVKLIGDEAYVPIKTFFEEYGSTVTWNPDDNTVTAQGEGYTYILKSGETSCFKNGVAYTLDFAPITIDGIMYVSPFEFSSMLSHKFAYDKVGRILTINPMNKALSLVNNPDKVAPAVSFKARFDDGNVPDNLFDYNLSTRWSADGEGDWVLMDLGEAVDIDKAMIAFNVGNTRRTKFDLEVSEDGERWTKVFSGESSGTTTNLEEYSINAKARYVKFIGYGNNLNAWISPTEIIILKK